MLDISKKINLNFLYKIAFYFMFYISFIILFITFEATASPDFEKYENYFLYYSGNLDVVNLEQGHFYFFFLYCLTNIISIFTNVLDYFEIFNLSLHLGNSVLYLYGLLGIIKYLKFMKFRESNIYLSMILVTFLPASFQLRMTFKPEILVIAFIGWIIYYFSLYHHKKNVIYAYLSLGLACLLVTSKISILFMVAGFFLVNVVISGKKISFNDNKLILIFGFLLLVSLFVENNNHNDKPIYEVDHIENYLNSADPSFFININKTDLINNPNRYFHYDSFIAITLFDTFSDFFQLYWNSEYSELNMDRKDFFIIEKVPENMGPINVNYDKETLTFTLFGDFDRRWDDPNYIDETRRRFAFWTSAIFYTSLLIFGLFKKRSLPFLLTPFIGIFFTALSASGLITQNFDPETADSVKTYYYSFFIVLGFIFLVNEIFDFKRIFRKSITFLMLLLFLFFLGFPHSTSEDTQKTLEYKNSLLATCELNKPILDNIFGIEIERSCKDSELLLNKYNPRYSITEIDLKFHLSKTPIINTSLFIVILFLQLFSRYNKNLKNEETKFLNAQKSKTVQNIY